jgi:ankyrin repeat protein
VQHHRETILSKLIAAGADPNAKNRLGQTPLHLAAHHGRPALAQELLAAGARGDLPDRQGRTPLDLARLPSKDPNVAKGRATVAAQIEAALALKAASATPAR